MVIAIAVGAVVVGAVAADRLLAFLAVRYVASRIGAASHASSPPVVRIAGVPFVTQMLTGRYRDVQLTLAELTAGEVEFQDITARLTEVRAPLRPLLAGDGLVAGRFTGAATIPDAALARKLPPGLALKRSGDQLVVVSSLLPVPAAGALHVAADIGGIRVTPTMLGIPSLVGFTIALPPMPPRLAVDSVSVSGDGLLVSLRGDDVHLSGLRAQVQRGRLPDLADQA